MTGRGRVTKRGSSRESPSAAGSPLKQRTIQSFFSGKAVTKVTKVVLCPICSMEVAEKRINEHMDDIAECKIKNFSDGLKFSKEKEASLALCDEYFEKEDDIEELLSHASNQENTIVHLPSTPKKASNTDDNEENLTSASPSQTIVLSQSISYNPSKFAGVACLRSSPKQKILPSGTKRASENYRKSPAKKSNESLIYSKDNLPKFPQHEPFTPSKKRNPDYVPYYVRNFEYVIACVIDCTDDKDLFNDQEKELIETYRMLSLEARKLYVRLFSRKHVWITVEKMHYDEIPNVVEACEELISYSFVDPVETLNDLQSVLQLLNAPAVKLLGKEFHCISKASNKTEIIAELLKTSQRKNNFFQAENTLESRIIKRGKELSGSCYKVNPASRSVLLRVLCLWGLNSWWESREEGGQPAALTNILLVNRGNLAYPAYTIHRVSRIFRHRQDLLQFEAAVQLEDRLETAVANKEFEAGYTVAQHLLGEFQSISEEFRLHVGSLPVFLQKFTALSVFIVALNKAVDLFEKMKKYDEAVSLLRRLLELEILDKFRGHWYERLSLDLDSHLKNPREALTVVETALDDPKVRGGKRLMLTQRAVKICKSKKLNLVEELSRLSGRADWDCPAAEELPTVTITGKMLNRDGQAGKSVFQTTDGTGQVTFCSVEELCLTHYREQGFSHGLHAEGAVFNTLLQLLFWDIIYCDGVADVFRDPGQAAPLDWDTESFYPARRDQVEARLTELRECDSEEVAGRAAAAWKDYNGLVCLASWELFPSVERLVGLLHCLPPASLAAVMERMVRDHRATRSGLPDLTVWCPRSGQLRCVEVKGPGDRLSTKQILWIRFLNSAGIQTEVCHVTQLGSKGGQ